MSFYDYKAKKLKKCGKPDAPSEVTLQIIRQFARTCTDTKTEIPLTHFILN